MTYQAYDTSISSGSPAELYRFNYWGDVFRYCSLDGGVSDYTHSIAGSNETFKPTTISHGSLESTEEMSRNSLEITVPNTFPVAQLFIAAPPEGIITVTIFRFHTTDPDKGYITSFKGRVLSCGFKEDQATLTCEPIFTSLRRPGLRMTYDAQCPYGLYDNNCTLDRSDWEINASVIGVSNFDLTISEVAGYPTGWFTGGVFQSGVIRRMITGNTGATLTLMHPAPASVLGLNCLLLPGCSHTRSDCGPKFNNAINFGGFPWMPLKNPFSGDNIFW
jgi:uncharacterized phage protein (TIGR02218 family)